MIDKHNNEWEVRSAIVEVVFWAIVYGFLLGGMLLSTRQAHAAATTTYGYDDGMEGEGTAEIEGIVYCNSWATCRAATTAHWMHDWAATEFRDWDMYGVSRWQDTYILIQRYFFTVDVPDGEIASSTFSFTTKNTDQSTIPTVHLVPAEYTAGEHTAFGGVDFESFGSVQCNANTTCHIHLNQDGLNYLNAHKGGTAQFAIIDSHDYDDTVPANDQLWRMGMYKGLSSDASKRPQFEIEYTESTPPPPQDESILMDSWYTYPTNGGDCQTKTLAYAPFAQGYGDLVIALDQASSSLAINSLDLMLKGSNTYGNCGGDCQIEVKLCQSDADWTSLVTDSDPQTNVDFYALTDCNGTGQYLMNTRIKYLTLGSGDTATTTINFGGQVNEPGKYPYVVIHSLTAGVGLGYGQWSCSNMYTPPDAGFWHSGTFFDNGGNTAGYWEREARMRLYATEQSASTTPILTKIQFNPVIQCPPNFSCVVPYRYDEQYFTATSTLYVYDKDMNFIDSYSIVDENPYLLGRKSGGQSYFVYDTNASTTLVTLYVQAIDKYSQQTVEKIIITQMTDAFLDVFGNRLEQQYIRDNGIMWSLTGTTTHALVCTNEEWLSTSTVTRIRCNLTKTALDMADLFARLGNQILKGLQTAVANVFPFNIPIQFSNSWSAAYQQPLPSELSYIDTYVDVNGNLFLPMPSGMSGSATTVPVIRAADYSGNTSGFFLFIRYLSKYVMYGLFIFNIYVLALSIYSSLYHNED